MTNVVYLASPHSHPDEEIRHWRWQKAVEAAALLFASSVMVYSPIVHTHHIAIYLRAKFGPDYQLDWEYWKEFDSYMLACCDRLIVLCLPGWEESVGVKAEIELAKELEMPIEYMYPPDKDV